MLRTADDVSLEAPGMGSANSTKGLFAEFHMEAEQDPAESEKQGRAVFKEVEYVTIRVPGDKDNDIIRAVRPSDKQSWPVQYAAFKAGLYVGGADADDVLDHLLPEDWRTHDD